MKLSNANRLADKDRAMDMDVEHLCPECGAPMVEVDRLEEDGAVFIWYSCTRECCTGQWLAKRVSRMCGA
jgi:hypothetical protein